MVFLPMWKLFLESSHDYAGIEKELYPLIQRSRSSGAIAFISSNPPIEAGECYAQRTRLLPALLLTHLACASAVQQLGARQFYCFLIFSETGDQLLLKNKPITAPAKR